MPDEVDLSSLTSLPAPALAPAAEIRARGEQRSRRARAALAGAAALVVLATAGTAVALADRGKPTSLQIGDDPSVHACRPADCIDDSEPKVVVPDGPATLAPRYDPEPISWQAFPTVNQIMSTLSGDWVAEEWGHPDGGGVYDRCDGSEYDLPSFTTRSLHTVDGRSRLALAVDDFTTTAQAGSVMSKTRAALEHCPVALLDGPGAGSQSSVEVLRSSAKALTYRDVQRECQRDHAECKDSHELISVVRAGHLLLHVELWTAAATASSTTAVEALSATFSQRAVASYGRALATPHVSPAAPRVGQTYYAAVLGAGGPNSLAQAQADALAAGYPDVPTLPISCLENLTAQMPGRTQPGASAALLFFDAASSVEMFLNAYSENASVEGTAKVTVRCLS